MNKPSGQNQRRFERYRGRIACRISLGEEVKPGFVTDLSPNGLFLECRSTLSPGAKVVLTLDGPDDTPLQLTGHVARERRSHSGVTSVVSPGFAVELESAPEAYFQIVADLDRNR